MSTIKGYAPFALALVITCATVVLAQEEPPATDPLGLLEQLIIVIIPVVTGVVLQGVKQLVAAIPNEWLPIIAPVIGMLSQVLAAAFEVDLTPGIDGIVEAGVTSGALGMTAVGAHQMKQQFVRKK